MRSVSYLAFLIGDNHYFYVENTVFMEFEAVWVGKIMRNDGLWRDKQVLDDAS